MSKKDIASYNYEELTEEMNRIGTKSFRGKQIYSWLHQLVDSFEEMTNLPKNLREKLDEEYEIRQVSVVKRQISKMDPTEKFLFELEDGNMIESVLMKYNYGNSVCISSQVGCRMGCVLCIDNRWKGTKSDCIRDATTDLRDTENHRRAGIEYRSHGKRRTVR